MYTNMFLIKKYGKLAPTTWNELIETGKYIMEQEKLNGNTDLIAYNGLFGKYDKN